MAVGLTHAATATRGPTVNCGWSAIWTMSFLSPNLTASPLIPGTQLRLSACCAWAPFPDESMRKFELGEQSSKRQNPDGPLGPTPPSNEPLPPEPPAPAKLPPTPTLPPTPK